MTSSPRPDVRAASESQTADLDAAQFVTKGHDTFETGFPKEL
jgi:hypothetical protein